MDAAVSMIRWRRKANWTIPIILEAHCTCKDDSARRRQTLTMSLSNGARVWLVGKDRYKHEGALELVQDVKT